MKQLTLDILESRIYEIDDDISFIEIRRKIQNAMDDSPTSVTLEQAFAQLNVTHRI